ncbi:MAG: formate dehydrogenase [Azospirillum sp.]|nr:formate dehydrogenase [Azospirillum sp.]
MPPNDPPAGVDSDGKRLAMMANQIALFFAIYPTEEAAAAVANHINQFWGRAMRRQFLASFSADDPTFHPLVARAFTRIRPPDDRWTVAP